MKEAVTECPDCGVDAAHLHTYNMEWEVTEGPHRGDSGRGKVIICEHCGTVHGIRERIPAFDPDDEETMQDESTDDDDSTEPETPISDLFSDLERTMRTVADEINEGFDQAERRRRRRQSPFERLIEQMTKTARETRDSVRIDVEDEIDRIREEQGKEPADRSGPDSGLYPKYEVRKDGQPVEDCFVLEPESDSAARAALRTYIEATDDQTLARDLRDWLDSTDGGFRWGPRDG